MPNLGLLLKSLMGSPQTFQPGGLQQAMQQVQQPDPVQTAGIPPSGGGFSLRDFLDPSVALPMAGAMFAGETPGQSFGNALMLGGTSFGKMQDKRKAMDYFGKNSPDLAAMITAGMPVEEAWKSALKQKNIGGSDVTYSAPTLMTKADGTQGYVMFGNDGSMKEPDSGGLKPGKVTYRNQGTYTAVLDAAGNEIAQIPIENYQAKYDSAAGTHAGGEQGDAIAKLNTMKSMMPGLQTTVSELDGLAKKATYTLAGKGRDYLAGQVGVATEGAVARTEYVNKVRTQIFPMLRSTFGAQFTVAEGDALVATMGDPDTTPEQKQAALRAFIVAKQREIESLAAQTGQSVASPTPGGAPAPSGGAVTSTGVPWSVSP